MPAWASNQTRETEAMFEIPQVIFKASHSEMQSADVKERVHALSQTVHTFWLGKSFQALPWAACSATGPFVSPSL